MPMNAKLLCFLLSVAATGSVTANPVTVDFEDTPVAQIFYHLAEFRQANLVIAHGVSGSLTVRLRDVEWPQAVALVAEMAGVTARCKQNILRISPRSGDEKTGHPPLDSVEAALPLETRRFVLRYTDVNQVRSLLLKENAGPLTPRGRISLNSRANMLIIRDTGPALVSIAQWITLFDIPVPQVEITAHIVTISEEQLRELGVGWGLGGVSSVNDILASPSLDIPLSVESAFFSAGMTLARINGQLLNLELSALEQENQIEIIASPRLITSHGNVASIKQGTEIPYIVSQGRNENATVEFKEAVLGMQITPEVLGEGNVRLTIRLSQNVPGKALQKGNNVPLSIDKQEIETKVTIQDGQTVALGGIFQQQTNNQQNKVPVIGELPAIGRLFRQDVSQQTKRELVIFITPRLVFP